MSVFRKILLIVDTVRLLLLNAVFIIFLALLFVAIAVFKSANSPAALPNTFVLALDLQGRLVETNQETGLSGWQSGNSETLLRELQDALDRAQKDRRVQAVLLDLRNFSGGSLPNLKAAAEAIHSYKASGKPIIAYADSLAEGSYLLAASAGRIWLDAMGSLALDGFNLQSLYFKEALDRFSLNAYVFRRGRYKSAVEPLMANQMSPESRTNAQSYLSSMWNSYVSSINSFRPLSKNKLESYILNFSAKMQQFSGNNAGLALEEGLIDGIGPIEEAIAAAGIEKPEFFSQNFETGSVRFISYTSYLQALNPPKETLGEGQIALIYASGTIVDGESQSSEMIGADTLSDLILETVQEPKTEALVLRIDSGGGSSSASEKIYRALTYAKTQVPVIISMGSAAASGAYWLSLAAHEIWADEATITGSIGVFTYMVSPNQLLKNLGVHTDGAAAAGLPLRIYGEPDAQTLAALDSSVGFVYQNFLQRLVQTRRAQSIEQADALAQGRIYSGAQAKEAGLVDNLGSLKQALERAAQLAELQEYSIRHYETEPSLLNRLVKYINRYTSISAINLPFSKQTFETLQHFNALEIWPLQGHAVYAWEPFRLVLP